jgi:hypothetical protein
MLTAEMAIDVYWEPEEAAGLRVSSVAGTQVGGWRKGDLERRLTMQGTLRRPSQERDLLWALGRH